MFELKVKLLKPFPHYFLRFFYNVPETRVVAGDPSDDKCRFFLICRDLKGICMVFSSIGATISTMAIQWVRKYSKRRNVAPFDYNTLCNTCRKRVSFYHKKRSEIALSFLAFWFVLKLTFSTSRKIYVWLVGKEPSSHRVEPSTVLKRDKNKLKVGISLTSWTKIIFDWRLHGKIMRR